MTLNRPSTPTNDVAVMMRSMAAALVASNYPAPQAKNVLRHVAQTYGADVDVELLPTMVMSQSRGDSQATFQTIGTPYRFDQMVGVQTTLATIRRTVPSPSVVVTDLEAVRQLRPLFPGWLRILGFAVSALGFAASFQFDWRALVGAMLMGLVIGVVYYFGSKVQQLVALLPLIATLLSGLMVVGAAVFFDSLAPVRLVAVAVVVLLPGATLTSGLIELVSGYMVSGAARLMYALMILGTMAFGFALALSVGGLTNARLEDFTAHLTPLWVAWVGAAVFALGTFLYFCTPLRLWIPSLVVIVVSYMIAMVQTSGIGAALMAGVATLVGLILSWVFNARMGGGPGDLAIFLPTFWLIVPGSVGFTVIAGSIEDKPSLADLAGQGALTFIAMAIAMMIGSALYPLIARITPRGEKPPPATT